MSAIYIKLLDLFFVKAENIQNNEIVGDIEMISKIVEEKYEKMIGFPIDYYCVAMSSVPGLPIIFKYPDNEVIFECTINKGSFKYDKKITSVIAKVDEKIFWCPGNIKEFTEQAYIDIILKKNGSIVGYAVIEIVKKDNTCDFTPKLLKACVFPKINGVDQNITIDQIKLLISEVKK